MHLLVREYILFLTFRKERDINILIQMKIGILSMQDIPNYGSVLQAYGLKKMFEKEGHEVYFISIEPNWNDDLLMSRVRDDFSNECSNQTNKAQTLFARYCNKYILNLLLHKFDIRNVNNKFEKFRKIVLNTEKTTDQYDVCVIGSDEVFNCSSVSKWGFTSQLFGNVEKCSKVILYAASCGSTTLDKLSDKVIAKIFSSLKKVSSFSVRDKNTYDFVSYFTPCNRIEEHLDPVLITDFSSEIENVDDKKIHQLNKKRYCIIYSYYNRMIDKDEIDSIKAFCKKKNLEIISLGAPQMWIRKYYALSPFELLKAFKQAAFVITDTFHGTIFSAKYSKRFATIVRASNKNKLLDLMKKIEIENHRLQKMEDIEKVYNISNENTLLANTLEKERNRTLDYFKRSI